ncbi:50S ribosomal protein L16 [Sphaeroforma arctica JP610]|uniref:50S ribosomal protein L16 n=1 Tax=Sphaeroforma arctica JP610 TaxID=667725 RepID=A0A0L0FMY6_9EUKA|nr:50S ribosomal protein L16 [Sphaeroforma arctica JP610]KNC77871.1 50S ribosomal protein L16 [Sphaeroforma arctica JP610]|eukprot:XP_014151773.1 50S ribosomal protein L16 [Sphaeroforma arctica JP610]
MKPKMTKHKKAFKGRVSSKPIQSDVDFGEYGLRALEPSRITAAQIYACKEVMLRRLRPLRGQLWTRIFPDIPVSEKPAEVRMGKGKGSVEYWCARVRPNTIIFEVGGIPVEAAQDALQQASFKLGIKTKFEIKKEVDYKTLLARPMPSLLVDVPSKINIES